MSVAAKRQLRLAYELEVMVELAFPPTKKADHQRFNGAHLVEEPAHQLYPCHHRLVRSDRDCCATESESDLACCYGPSIEEIPDGTLIGPIDFNGVEGNHRRPHERRSQDGNLG